MKFWVDECVTPELEAVAHSLGLDATSNRSRGMLGASDPVVYAKAHGDDRVFITENHEHFLRLATQHDVHPGLLLIDAHGLDCQVAAFIAAVEHVTAQAMADGESPEDWMIMRWVRAPAPPDRCEHGWTLSVS